jgi:hypothetical protein
MPDSFPSYLQQVGRAGRDNLQSLCLCFIGSSRKAKALLDPSEKQGTPSKRGKDSYMKQFLELKGSFFCISLFFFSSIIFHYAECRHKFFLRYQGGNEDDDVGTCFCDLCSPKWSTPLIDLYLKKKNGLGSERKDPPCPRSLKEEKVLREALNVALLKCRQAYPSFPPSRILPASFIEQILLDRSETCESVEKFLHKTFQPYFIQELKLANECLKKGGGEH